MDQNPPKIEIDCQSLTLKSELSLDCHLNLLESDFESSTIRFGMPNRLTLDGIELLCVINTLCFCYQPWYIKINLKLIGGFKLTNAF